MTTIRRYLGREVYVATGFVLFAFLGLFVFFDLINELRDVGRAGYRLQHAFGFVLLSVPGHVYELFPVAVLIGTLYALSLLASNSEYTVMRTSGFSPAHAGWTLFRMGAVFIVIIVIVGEFVTPYAERAGQRLRLAALGSTVAQEFRSGLWVRSLQSFVNVRQVEADATLTSVTMYEFDDDMRLTAISEARTGRYADENRWELLDVTQTRFTDKGAVVVSMPSMQWASVLTPEVLAVLTIDPRKMTAWNLWQYVQHLSANKQRTERYEIALWTKVVYPIAAWVMMALALPFAYVHARHGGLGWKVFSGIMLGILFHGLNSLIAHLGVLQQWPPAMAAALPSAMFLLAAVVMMWWVERR